MTANRVRTAALVAALSSVLVGCAVESGTAPLVATRLSFMTQPVAAVRDTAMPVAVTVAVLDQNDDVLIGAANTVALQIATNPGGAALTGTTSAPAVNGIATFSGLKLDATGTGFTLAATSIGLTDASSGAFNVTLSLADVDGDGLSPNAGDCDDTDAGRKPGLADDPDPSFLDSNCDGIDGTEAAAIFVSLAGANTAGCGTKASPCATIANGITRALALGFDVYIGPGTFTGSIELAQGVSLYGGFDAGWTRGILTSTIITGSGPVGAASASGQDITIYGNAITQALTIFDVRVNGVNATGLRPGSNAGKNSYAIVLRDIGPGVVTITRVQVFAGNGAAGANGANGTTAFGPPAPSGGDGGAGQELSVTCDQSSRGTAGLSATNPAATGGVDPTSGAGGEGGTMDTDCGVFSSDFDARPGLPGANAAVFQAALFGFGGSGGSGVDQCGPTTAGAPGRVINGAAGVAGNTAGALIDNGFWVGTVGGAGGLGDHGSGGGGGGGGGGCDQGTDAYGAGGGGGGAGGWRAEGVGTGGTAGGGSFGIYLINASPSISFTRIERGVGGVGGAGGIGGAGQSGGLGGVGGLHPGSAEAGSGGNGAHGGHAGGGAGGTGGNSIGIYRTGTSDPALFSITYLGGAGGSGGVGGLSAPTAPFAERDGNAGQQGTAGMLGTIIVP